MQWIKSLCLSIVSQNVFVCLQDNDTSLICFLQEDFKMVLEKVKAILAEQFDVEEDKITAETDLQEDLGADSLDVVDLLMSIEDEFDIEVPDEEVENLKTVGALVSYIEANS